MKSKVALVVLLHSESSCVALQTYDSIKIEVTGPPSDSGATDIPRVILSRPDVNAIKVNTDIKWEDEPYQKYEYSARFENDGIGEKQYFEKVKDETADDKPKIFQLDNGKLNEGLSVFDIDMDQYTFGIVEDYLDEPWFGRYAFQNILQKIKIKSKFPNAVGDWGFLIGLVDSQGAGPLPRPKRSTAPQPLAGVAAPCLRQQVFPTISMPLLKVVLDQRKRLRAVGLNLSRAASKTPLKTCFCNVFFFVLCFIFVQSLV